MFVPLHAYRLLILETQLLVLSSRLSVSKAFMSGGVRAFSDDSFDLPVRGFIHLPAGNAGDGSGVSGGPEGVHSAFGSSGTNEINDQQTGFCARGLIPCDIRVSFPRTRHRSVIRELPVRSSDVPFSRG